MKRTWTSDLRECFSKPLGPEIVAARYSRTPVGWLIMATATLVRLLLFTITHVVLYGTAILIFHVTFIVMSMLVITVLVMSGNARNLGPLFAGLVDFYREFNVFERITGSKK